MNTTSALEMLVNSAKRPTPVNQSELEEVRERVAKLKSINSELFGMEQNERACLAPQLWAALNQTELLERQKSAEEAGYKVLDLGPFSYRRPNGEPVLAIFSLNQPVFKLSSGLVEGTSERMIPRVPTKIEACYEDVFSSLEAGLNKMIIRKRKRHFRMMVLFLVLVIAFLAWSLIAWNVLCLLVTVPAIFGGRFLNKWLLSFNRDLQKTKVLYSRFDGVVPDSARKSIKTAEKIFGSDNVFVVAEVSKWNAKLERNDPLVTGWDGENLWLVDSFLPTSLEKLIEHKFAAPPA